MSNESLKSQSFSIAFAVGMIRAADITRGQQLWLRHTVNQAGDDQPEVRRHLLIRVRRPHLKDIEADCIVEKTSNFWTRGSVRIGWMDGGHVYSYDPEIFFEYSGTDGLITIRKVGIEVLAITGGGFSALVLDNPDIRPSVRGEGRLQIAIASTADEALGKLIRENPDLFRVVIR